MRILSTDWLDCLQSGDVDIALPELTVVKGNGSKFPGSGRVAWRAGSEARFSGATGGVEAFYEQPRSHPALGQLIPDEDYTHVIGTTHDGWELRTDPVPMAGCESSFSSPYLSWDLTTPGLTLTQKSGMRSSCRVVRALLGPSPQTWTRDTVTVVRDDEFPSEESCSDWLKSSLSFGALVARQRSDEWFEVKIVVQGNPPTAEAIKLVIAIVRAFSFVLGRRIFLRGYEDVTADYESRYLAARNMEMRRTELPQPLGHGKAYRDCVERLLAQATEFFLTERGERAAHYLHLCWDTADNDISTRVAIACISLEGLLREVSAVAGTDDGSHTPADVESARQWLKANECRLSARFVARVNGFLDNLDQRRPVDLLRGWQMRGVLDVTREDVRAWEEARNPAAHGALAWPRMDLEEKQTLLSRFYRVLNLVNRVVLQLVGYRGTYRDYSKLGWPEAKFPAANEAW